MNLDIFCTMKSVVKVPEHLKGLVIGKDGRIRKKIEQETGITMKVRQEGAVLEGNEEAVNKAKEMVQSIIQPYLDCFKKIIDFPMEYYGLVIGGRGKTLQSIQKETNTKISLCPGLDTNTALAHINGAKEENCDQAEQKIREIISKACGPKSEKTVSFPLDYYYAVYGKYGSTVVLIRRRTKTKITLEQGDDTALAHISGETEEQCVEAERLINEITSRPLDQFYLRKHCKRLAFVDGAYAGEDNEFRLKELQDGSQKPMYELIMEGEKLNEPRKVDYLPKLKETLLEVLREIHEENQESKNLRTDMWCHFGHAYICDVDDAEVDEFHQIAYINENLRDEDENRWNTHFKEGLETLELNDLEKALSNQPYQEEPYTRFDYTFQCLSGRRIRLKAFALQSSSSPDDISFRKSLTPMKSVMHMQELSNESMIKYYLCAPTTPRLKVDIYFPYLKLDCHLVVRTTLKDTSTVRDEEEDQILINFLNDNLKLKEGKLEFPEENLPDHFTVIYHRVCKRRIYSYKSSNNVDFNVKISEEESKQRRIEADVRIKTDIHLHCDEWDELLHDQEDWEPEAIVQKLPDFLDFMRDVQSNITPEDDE